MKFADYYNLPSNTAGLKPNALKVIESAASNNGGVVKLYFPVPMQYPTKEGMRWRTNWQLINYNIDTDQIEEMFAYVLVKTRKVMPPPREDDLGGLPYFTPEWMPKAIVKMLKKKVSYYKTGAKRE